MEDGKRKLEPDKENGEITGWRVNFVMFCPQCKAEYRDGFSRCSDCDIELVTELPVDPPEAELAPLEGHLRVVETTQDQNDCVICCKQLIAAGIPFKVAESNRQYLKGVERTFRIGVPARFYKAAQEIRNESRLDRDEASE
jgi:hypothetical protein